MYTTLEKLKNSLGDAADLLLQDVNDTRILEIIEECSSIIDAYLMVVYPVPFAKNAILESICNKLCKTECYRLFARNDLPDAIKNDEIQAFKNLVKIQNKQLLLEVQTTENQDIKHSCKPQFFTRWM